VLPAAIWKHDIIEFGNRKIASSTIRPHLRRFSPGDEIPIAAPASREIESDAGNAQIGG
jgi:hypothetical protein